MQRTLKSGSHQKVWKQVMNVDYYFYNIALVCHIVSYCVMKDSDNSLTCILSHY